MFTNSGESFKRKKLQCPQCGEIISDMFIQQNPFPEFPCPSCHALVSASSLRDIEFEANNERAEARLNATLKVSYKSYHEFITEYTKDVSNGGIFINTKRPHEINEIVELFIQVPGLDVPLLIRGQVVRIKVDNVPDEDAGIGIQFLDIDSGSRKTLIDYIKSQKISPESQ